ncbi:unnamed protein product, partial [Staurois parvus]
KQTHINYCILCSIRHTNVLEEENKKKNIVNQCTADIVQEMTRDYGHTLEDDQRLRTQYRR